MDGKTRFYLVYKTTNVVNGMYYIGCHTTQDKNDGYLGSGIRLRGAIKKYGKEKFEREVLFEATSKTEMYAKEKELVVLNSMSYNLTSGGHGGWDHLSKEFRSRQFTKDERHTQGVLGMEARRLKYGEQGHKESCSAAAKMVNSQRTSEEQKSYGRKGGLTTASRRTAKERHEWSKHASLSISSELYKKQAELFSLTYRIIHPNGTIEEIRNMRRYCKNNGLNQGSMASVASGRKPHYKGIIVQRLVNSL